MELVPSAETDAWNIAEGSRSGRPIFIRYRPGLEPFCGDSRYPRRLTVTWTYEPLQESGLPTDDQSDEMKCFEDALQKALDPDRVGILAFTFTSAGARQWHYYYGNASELQKRINVALSYSPNLPITLEAEPDENWSELRRLLNQCK